MKKKDFKAKLILNKETIANLNSRDIAMILGGREDRIDGNGGNSAYEGVNTCETGITFFCDTLAQCETHDTIGDNYNFHNMLSHLFNRVAFF